MNNQIYIDQILDGYYEDIPLSGRSAIKIGQIVWTHFFYNYEKCDVWRPCVLDESKTIARQFEIRTKPDDLFKKSLPLSSPPLKTDEEFLVIKAKKRPAIVLTLPPAKEEHRQIRRGEKVLQDLYLLAPLFSLYDDENKAKVDQEIVNRTRKLEYPHLFFLPKDTVNGLKDSLCRLDKVCGCLLVNIERNEICLTKQVNRLFFSQLASYVSGVTQHEYKDAYELFQ